MPLSAPSDSVTAFVMAGSRPGGDPLAAHFDVAAKALIRIAGEAMLSRVVRTLADHPGIARVVVFAQDPGLLQREPDCAWMVEDGRIAFAESAESLGATIARGMAQQPETMPWLVTTADNVLLTHAMLDSFLAGAQGCDLAVAMVERRVMQAAYPDARRTWLKFRGGQWSGANLFWLGSPRIAPIVGLWQRVEQERKKAVKIVGAFGPFMLAAMLFRVWTIHQAIRRAGARFGVQARVVPLAQAEACIDVDKVDDHVLAETILRRNPGYATR